MLLVVLPVVLLFLRRWLRHLLDGWRPRGADQKGKPLRSLAYAGLAILDSALLPAYLLLLASLFVLGGNFWDKIRSLFVHDAVAQFPGSSPADPS